MSSPIKDQTSSIAVENELNKQVPSQDIELENDDPDTNPLNPEHPTECKSDKADWIDCHHDSKTEILKSSLVVEPVLVKSDTDKATSSEEIDLSRSNLADYTGVSKSTSDEMDSDFKEQRKINECKSDGVDVIDCHYESEKEVSEASSDNCPTKSSSECKSALDGLGSSRSDGSKPNLLIEATRLSDDTDTSPLSQEIESSRSNLTDYTEASGATSNEIDSAFINLRKRNKEQKSSSESENESAEEGLDSHALLSLKNKKRGEESASSDDTIEYDYMAETRELYPSLSKEKLEEPSVPIIIKSINSDAPDNQSSEYKSKDCAVKHPKRSLHIKIANRETRIDQSWGSKSQPLQTAKKSKPWNLETIEEKPETVPADELQTFRDESVGIRTDISAPEKDRPLSPDSDIKTLVIDRPSTSQKRKLSTIYEETAGSSKNAKRLRNEEETEAEMSG